MITKVKDSIKYIKIKDLLSPFVFIIILPLSIIFRIYNKITKKHIWLVSEEDNTARDNGYHFFRYMRKEHPSFDCFYVIDKNCNDYDKVKNLGNIINFGSLKHWLYYMSSEYNISNQKASNPNKVLFYILHVYLKLYNNRVFLQHGITINDSEWIYYKNTNFRYFICGAKREYDYIIDKFGYPKENVILTGFSRWDNLHEDITEKSKILIMPTWRNWLGRELNNLHRTVDFKNTLYYKSWNDLLNNKDFINFIEKNDYTVYFYPHYHMQKFLHLFKTSSKSIKFVSTDVDIQYMLRTSTIMITDYSSVSLDFGYMLKPVIYYQFDEKEYREKQLKEGYYSYLNDGYGPICKNIKEIIKGVESVSKDSRIYKERSKEFFTLMDNNNSKRIYQELIKNK